MNALNPGLSPALQRLGEVSVRLSVELGRTDMPLKDVLALGEGSVVSLDRLTDELLEITANGQVIAFGEVIAQDGKFALRIVSLAGGDAPASGPPPRERSGARPSASPPTASPTVPHSGPRHDAPVGGHIPQPQAEAELQPDVTPQTASPAAPSPEAASPAPLPETEIDELAAALDDTLGEAPAPQPAGQESGSEEAQSDPLADALAELPEAPAPADANPQANESAGE